MAKKILIVDDDSSFREILTKIIKKWGDYAVETAADGQQALIKVTENAPDLVLLDILLPKMHGFAVCQKIKSNPKLKHIKVVMFSSKVFKADMDRAKTLGADDYVIKPVDFDVLKEKIVGILGEKKEHIKIKFWGTRGSISTPGRKYEKYGGNTACVEVRIDNQIIIIDAGTGIRELGMSLAEEFKEKPITGHLLISHTHWDHIQGFPFFAPAYMPENIFTIYGPMGADKNFERIFHGQHDLNYFPISLEDLSAKLNFIDLTGEEIDIKGVKISCVYLNHPGMTVGFKIECAGKSAVYATDNELVKSKKEADVLQCSEDYANFIEKTDLLIADAQYTDEEYDKKQGWGHGSITPVVESAVKAKVKELVLFHHDHRHSDEFIDKMEEDAQKKILAKNSKVVCRAAREGMVIDI